ncbi:glycosyltransferase [Pseudomonas capeferrum]|uniref:glycosyltransferase n=1 Tax=Pseudomonas capeferrum TaxID=1495066 RepID=UPI0015E42982|nr:glycosyltransferase [Pseudomonas capeferrum]MBA1200826.1 glycosyltransferase [Pseudomonas capeferrum]
MSEHYLQEPAIRRLLNGLEQVCAAKARHRAPKASTADVTVAVMSYNNAAFLGQTIDSVLAQKGVTLELRVFDDCSPDDSVQLLERYRQDPRFSYQVNPRNLGMIDNYNQCLRAGTGRYVVVLGSDDLLYPGHLSSLVEAMDRNPQVALGYTQCMWIDEESRMLRHGAHAGHRAGNYVGGRDELADLLSYDSYITPSAAMFRRSILPSLTLDDGRIHRKDMLAGDWELWTRMAQVAPDFLFLHQATVGYRVHDGQISQGFYASEKPLEEHTRILELNLATPAARQRLQRGAMSIWRFYERRLAAQPAEVQARFDERKMRIHQSLFDFSQGQNESTVLFSVIVTTFNRPVLLMDALGSLASQTFRDFEVILVNDNGTPVESLLTDFDFPITYLRQGRNQGPAAARNTAHRLARGRYLVYLDDDDRYLPDHLQVLAQGIEAYPNAVVYTDSIYIIEKLEGDTRVELRREQRYPHAQFSVERLFVDNYIPINTFAWPRSLLDSIGGFDEVMHGLEDWDFLMRLAARASFQHLYAQTVEVRLREATNDPTRRSAQALSSYGELYQLLYARHSDLNNDSVRRERRKMLRRFGLLAREPGASSQLEWLRRRSLTAHQQCLIEERLQDHGQGPRFAFFVLDLTGDAEKVAATRRSLEPSYNGYANSLATLLTVAPQGHEGFSGPVLQVSEENWIETLNRCIGESTFDWSCILEAGDVLTPNGLLVAGLELLTAPDCRAIYCDSMYRQEDGTLAAALLPDFNLDYLLSLPAAMGRHWLLNRTALVEAGGFDARYAQAPEFELVLRLITLGGLDGLGHVAEPLVVTRPPRLLDNPDEKKAIIEHLQARGYQDPDVVSDQPGHYRVRYGHPQQPLVSVLILTGSKLPHLQRCVESLLSNTRYPNYEILLIESDASAADIGEWLLALEALGESRLRTLRPTASLPTAALIDHASTQTNGEYLLLLSAETAIIDGDWLDELLNHGQRPEVGVVGAKLLSADGKVRHAGLILGLDGPAGRPFDGELLQEAGYMQRLLVDQDYSAVSRDCLLIRREIHEALGGLSDDIPDAFLDVDLCLRVTQAGFLTVWAANARLMISEESMPKASVQEEDILYHKWLPRLARDPAYNPNFSQAQPGGFKLAQTALSWRPLSSWKPLPTVLAHPAQLCDSSQYRIVEPFNALQQACAVDGTVSLELLHVTDLERYAPDSIVLQRQLSEERLAGMRRIGAFSRAFKVYEWGGDGTGLSGSASTRATLPDDLRARLLSPLALVDRLVVPTQRLAQALEGMHTDIRVVQSRLPVAAWSALQRQQPLDGRARIGLTANSCQTVDLSMLVEVMAALGQDVEWVFFGHCPALLRSHVSELHGEVGIDEYPTRLAQLNLDIALAPLDDNLFNECRHHLALLEFGACGYPVISSDIGSTTGLELPVTRARNTAEGWIEAIRMHLSESGHSVDRGDALQAVVRQHWLLDESNLEAWRKAWLAD